MLDPHLGAQEELKQYLGHQYKAYTLQEAASAASDEWRSKNPQGPQAFEDYYRNSELYQFEIASWNSSKRKVRVYQKVQTVLDRFQAQHIIDFGAGIGSDTIALHNQGFKVSYYEISHAMQAFFKWRCQQRNIQIPILKELQPTQCFLFLDVIEHLHDPFKQLDQFMNMGQMMVFTQSFKEHDPARGGMPYHTDYSVGQIHRHIIKNRWQKLKVTGMAFPPLVYRK